MEDAIKEIGVQDNSGNFTWHPFYWRPVKFNKNRASHVCLATHTSVNGLFWLPWQSQAWLRTISVAVYAPGSDLGPAVAMINYLRKCFPGILQRTSFHLVYPTNMPAYVIERWVASFFIYLQN